MPVSAHAFVMTSCDATTHVLVMTSCDTTHVLRCRPQTGSPALRATTLMEYASDLLKASALLLLLSRSKMSAIARRAVCCCCLGRLFGSPCGSPPPPPFPTLPAQLQQAGNASVVSKYLWTGSNSSFHGGLGDCRCRVESAWVVSRPVVEAPCCRCCCLQGGWREEMGVCDVGLEEKMRR